MTSKAWSYIRLSTAEQAVDGRTGEARQTDAAQAYAAQHGLTLQPALMDLGVSAFRGRNRKSGDLAKFLSMIELGLVDHGSYFLVENCDRLSREDPFTALATFTAIINAGVNVVTTDDGQFYNREVLTRDPMKLVMWIIQTIRGNSESTRKGEMVTKAANRRKEAARAVGRAIDGNKPSWLNRRPEGGFEVDPEKKRVIARIFRELDQGLGGTRIAQGLNRDGIPPFNQYRNRSTRGWHHGVVLHLAQNRAIIGEHQMTKIEGVGDEARRVADGLPLDDWWPRALDDEAMFHRVQGLIQRRAQTHNHGGGRRGQSMSNLFGGLCRCVDCGDEMNYVSGFTSKKGVTTRPVLLCGNAARRHGCDNRRRVRYAEIERQVLQFVREVDLFGQGDRSPAEIDLELLQARRVDEVKRRDAILAQLDDGPEIPSVMGLIRKREESIAELDAKIVDLKARSEIDGAIVPPSDQQEAARRLFEEMGSKTGDELFRLRARLAIALKGVIDRIVFEGGEPPIVYMIGGKKFYQLGVDSVRYVKSNSPGKWSVPQVA